MSTSVISPARASGARCSWSRSSSSTACRRGRDRYGVSPRAPPASSLYVVLAIGLQNVPEGTASAIPTEDTGLSPPQQFWAAVLTSAPQPVGAMVAFVLVEEIESLLPASFGFAAGAMLALVATQLLPEALAARRPVGALAGAASGAALMIALALVLGVS
jgi:zinc transporter, ZIP family